MVISSRFPSVVHHFAGRNQSRSASLQTRIRARGWARWHVNAWAPWPKYQVRWPGKQVEARWNTVTDDTLPLCKQNALGFPLLHFHIQQTETKKGPQQRNLSKVFRCVSFLGRHGSFQVYTLVMTFRSGECQDQGVLMVWRSQTSLQFLFFTTGFVVISRICWNFIEFILPSPMKCCHWLQCWIHHHA